MTASIILLIPLINTWTNLFDPVMLPIDTDSPCFFSNSSFHWDGASGYSSTWVWRTSWRIFTKFVTDPPYSSNPFLTIVVTIFSPTLFSRWRIPGISKSANSIRAGKPSALCLVGSHSKIFDNALTFCSVAMHSHSLSFQSSTLPMQISKHQRQHSSATNFT